MRATEVLMQQADLRDRLTDRQDGTFYDIVANTIASMWDVPVRTAAGVSDSAYAAAEYGETFLIAENMTDVITAAAESLDDSDHVSMDMFPSRQGVIRFDKPVEFTDIRGTNCKVHWVTWDHMRATVTNAFGTTSVSRSLVLTLWNDLADPDEIATSITNDLKARSKRDYERFTRSVGRWSCVGALMIRDGQRVGAPARAAGPKDVYTADGLSQEAESLHLNTLPEVVHGSEVVNLGRIVWATVLLMGQEIVSTTRSEHTKAETKVLRRNGAAESLRVVTLRRRSPSSQGGGSALTARSLTRGHWAWRHCGESHPMAQEYDKGYHARVWINPYLRGPEGAPIRTTKKVYKLAR